jgi:signal transduction histidine kinase
MYYTLLVLHSAVRWLVLISLIVAIIRAYRGWKNRFIFTTIDDRIRFFTAIIAHIQLVLGVLLYFLSPIITYFFNNFKTAVHEREIRFFGMEHVTVMIIALVLITIGSMKAKRQTKDEAKFKTMFVWYLIAFIAILTSIPWAFSPLVSRPYFRAF